MSATTPRRRPSAHGRDEYKKLYELLSLARAHATAPVQEGRDRRSCADAARTRSDARSRVNGLQATQGLFSADGAVGTTGVGAGAGCSWFSSKPPFASSPPVPASLEAYDERCGNIAGINGKCAQRSTEEKSHGPRVALNGPPGVLSKESRAHRRRW